MNEWVKFNIDPYPKVCVYALFNKHELVYVGVAKNNLQSRINFHKIDNKKFDNIKYLKVETFSQAWEIEKYLIMTHKPRFNKESQILKHPRSFCQKEIINIGETILK